jgi:hypothetical protein
VAFRARSARSERSERSNQTERERRCLDDELPASANNRYSMPHGWLRANEEDSGFPSAIRAERAKRAKQSDGARAPLSGRTSELPASANNRCSMPHGWLRANEEDSGFPSAIRAERAKRAKQSGKRFAATNLVLGAYWTPQGDHHQNQRKNDADRNDGPLSLGLDQTQDDHAE